MSSTQQFAALLLVGLPTLVSGHGDEHINMEDMGTMGNKTATVTNLSPEALQYEKPNYFALESHSNLILAHILFMIIAWFFILPLGVVFSIGRSKLALPVQFLFITLNGLGVAVGTIYNINTPDLYEHNAHHTIGWIATWVMVAQLFMSILFVYSGRTKKENTIASERAAFLPASLRSHPGRSYHDYRWSGDSGHGTEPSSPSRGSREISPYDASQGFVFPKPEAQSEEEDDDADDTPEVPMRRRPSWFKDNFLDKYLARKVPSIAGDKLLNVMEILYEMIDRTILILGFITLTSGIVIYSGIMRGNNIFNGLAHFVKGGIFFWYGLLTLGRWMGCFADLGWAWNVKPTRSEVGWKSKVPSAEFVESFVIFLYGCTNVFMEHLAAWGGKWTAQDLEHVSISVMFFGGGLAGMLIESTRIRKWLNTSVDMMPTRTEAHPSDVQEMRTLPKTYAQSMNPMPALIILLLGVMMSSHHQDSMVSTMVHKQWGTLLCGFSLARGFTYIVNYISPPTSIYPARPPTELISSFCLISGGIVFMLSTKDVIHYLEKYNIMAMFTFTVTMGFTAFLMAYQILVLSLKGWALRRETHLSANS